LKNRKALQRRLLIANWRLETSRNSADQKSLAPLPGNDSSVDIEWRMEA